MASGKLKKDKDGNWEFEYDDDNSEDSEQESPTIQADDSNRPGSSACAFQPLPSNALNLVDFAEKF